MKRFGPPRRCVWLWLALLAPAASAAPIELPSRAGAVPFDHGRHAAREGTRCAVCHHTSAGTDVRVTCRQCHLPSARALPDSRAAFHGSCIGCHETRQRSGQPTGPTKRCSGCHAQTEENRD